MKGEERVSRRRGQDRARETRTREQRGGGRRGEDGEHKSLEKWAMSMTKAASQNQAG